MTTKPEMLLWLSDARGQYIPRDFANSFSDRSKHVANVSAEEWAILEAGPDHEFYWDTWADVSDTAVITDENGIKFHVWQDGDCWLVPDGMVWSDENETFEWPADESVDSE